MKLTSYQAGKLLGIAAITAFAAISQARPIYVNVDGRNVRFDGTKPQMMGDHIMVPLRGIFERMGASVDWNSQDQMVMANRGNTKVELRINNNEAYINGRAVPVQYPAQVVDGSTMVPIRFISESLGAYVDWDETSSTVNISTNGTSSGNYRNNNGNNGGSSDNNTDNRNNVLSIQPRGSVLPVKLDADLSSDNSQVGDKFTATIDTNGNNDYFGLPQGTKVQGHVNFAQAKRNDTPGVLGLSFDRLLLANGRNIPITASLIGLDKDSVRNEDGRIVVNPDSQKKQDDLKYVGTGAGAGALIALVTKGNVITNTVIGGALGYLYETLIDKPKTRNVTLARGTPLGVRFDQEAKVRIFSNN